MATLPFAAPFDPSTVEPDNFDIVPAGDYTVMITESDMKPTKTGNGQFLELKLQIQDGPQKGRVLFDRLNLDNPNRTAVEIAQKTLSSICRAIGTGPIRDSQQLHNAPLVVKVTVSNSEQWGERNEIKGYKPAKPAPVAAAATGTTAKKPWEK